MREFTIVFEDGIKRGLKPNSKTQRKEQWLQEALGAIPEDEVLQSIPQLPDPPTLSDNSFPYPQIFKLRKMTLVCTSRTIYQLEDGVLTPKFNTSSIGATWSVADFDDYIVLTNGSVVVERNPETGRFDEYIDCKIPPSLCILNLNGQLIIGAPGIRVSSGFTGT